MATRFSSTLLADNAADANFRAWAQFIEDTLVTTGGWLVTSDSGQTLPSALVHPTTTSQKMGYRVYQMNDALQATVPVFMRIDFGSSSGTAAAPAIWVTVGTGSNGSGTITGIMMNAVQMNSAGNSSQANNSYGSAAPNRVAIALFCQNVTGIRLVFTLERSKDVNGNDTGAGLLCIYNSTATWLESSRYLNYATAGVVQPSVELGLSYVLTTQNPSQSFAPGDIGVAVVSCIRGVAQQPGLNVMIVPSGDVGDQGQFSMNIYGAAHTYQQISSQCVVQKALCNANRLADNNARACIRYD